MVNPKKKQDAPTGKALFAVAHERGAQRFEVVDLSIEHQHMASIARWHGLRAGLAEIDHRQAAMP